MTTNILFTPTEGGVELPLQPETINQLNKIIQTHNANTQHTGRVYPRTEGANSGYRQEEKTQHTQDN